MKILCKRLTTTIAQITNCLASRNRHIFSKIICNYYVFFIWIRHRFRLVWSVERDRTWYWSLIDPDVSNNYCINMILAFDINCLRPSFSNWIHWVGQSSCCLIQFHLLITRTFSLRTAMILDLTSKFWHAWWSLLLLNIILKALKYFLSWTGVKEYKISYCQSLWWKLIEADIIRELWKLGNGSHILFWYLLSHI